jgi:16S rRNA (guanine527-N7)-methyltransferase
MQEILRQGAANFNLSLTGAQLSAFEDYASALIAWNRRVNLTRIVEPDEIAVRHFLDSLAIRLALPPGPASFSLIDVGSGAGFPGVPLKIACPDIQLTLLEATGKKAAFLHHLIEVLKLTGVTILAARAEAAGRLPDRREQYDVAVARAVAALPVLAEYTLPLVKVGGTVIAQKGADPMAEIDAASKALAILGGQLDRVLPVTIPGLDAPRHLVVINKVKPTPQKYPRRPGMPAKRPIE